MIGLVGRGARPANAAIVDPGVESSLSRRFGLVYKKRVMRDRLALHVPVWRRARD